jgi:large subunit ribosomal protein L19
MNKIDQFNKSQLKELPEIRPGYTICVYQKIKEAGKERIQPFEGLVIARKHGRGINATITVRKISHGVGVEKIFPLHSPLIEKIEVIKKGKVRRAKLYYIREKSAKESRLKEKREKKEEKTERVKEEKIDKEEAKEENQNLKNSSGSEK